MLMTSTPPRPKDMQQVTDWYDEGKLTVPEAIKWQQHFCKHLNYTTDNDGFKHCHDCGKAHQTCSLCIDDQFEEV